MAKRSGERRATEKITSFPVIRASANYGRPTLFRASGASIYLGTRVKAQWPIKELQRLRSAPPGTRRPPLRGASPTGEESRDQTVRVAPFQSCRAEAPGTLTLTHSRERPPTYGAARFLPITPSSPFLTASA